MTSRRNNRDSTERGKEWRFDRRTVLRSAAVASAAGFTGLPALSGRVVAQTGETLYLIENVGNGDAGDGQTPAADNGPFLFEVTLDSGTGEAELSEISDLPDRITAGHIGATPDGAFLWTIDRDTGAVAKYDVSGSSFSGSPTQIDATGIGGWPGGVVQVAFSPDGTLYFASNNTDTLYKVNDLDTSPSAEVVGSTGIDVQGADIAFSADGTLFLYSNAEGSPSGKLFTVDPSTGAATAVASGSTGEQFTGLAVRGAGTGDLVGSTTNPADEVVVFERTDGSIVDRFSMVKGGSSYNYDFGDMTVGALDTCPETTLELCAGQDIDVGTVEVTESGGTLYITYDLTDPWRLTETHVDIGDELGDLHTNKPGNPQVGQFDLSETHDFLSEYTYEVECDSEAFSDVDFPTDTLYIATHAVVQPVEGCADFTAFDPGDSVEGLGTAIPTLDVESTSGVSGAEAVAVEEGVSPRAYGADNDSLDTNGCLGSGFTDIATKNAGEPHSYEFTVAEGANLNEFSLRMLDFGDYNPDTDTHHFAEMVAYDADGDMVDSMTLEYYTEAEVNPTTAWDTSSHDTVLWDNLLEGQGDACDAEEGEPGNWVWSVSGEAITTVELTFGDGHDPNIAFTDLCFETDDETAWTCLDQDGVDRFVDRGNWATYFTYATCEEAGGLDCDTE